MYYTDDFRKDEYVTLYPADVVLFEGILIFYSQEIRDNFQMKLFVDTDADTRLSRRGEAASLTFTVMNLVIPMLYVNDMLFLCWCQF